MQQEQVLILYIELSAIDNLLYHLPLDAYNIAYYDRIGNITQSAVKKKVNLENIP